MVALHYLEQQLCDFRCVHLSLREREAFFFISALCFMGFGSGRNSQAICKLGFVRAGGHMMIFPFAAFTVHFHPIWKELDRCWSCVSLSNTAPAASVQPDTSDRHFEAKLFEQVHLVQMKGAQDCFSFPLFVAAFLKGKNQNFLLT